MEHKSNSFRDEKGFKKLIQLFPLNLKKEVGFLGNVSRHCTVRFTQNRMVHPGQRLNREFDRFVVDLTKSGSWEGTRPEYWLVDGWINPTGQSSLAS